MRAMLQTTEFALLRRVAAEPAELTIIVLLIDSSDARALAGKRTRSG